VCGENCLYGKFLLDAHVSVCVFIFVFVFVFVFVCVLHDMVIPRQCIYIYITCIFACICVLTCIRICSCTCICMCISSVYMYLIFCKHTCGVGRVFSVHIP